MQYTKNAFSAERGTNRIYTLSPISKEPLSVRGYSINKSQTKKCDCNAQICLAGLFCD